MHSIVYTGITTTMATWARKKVYFRKLKNIKENIRFALLLLFWGEENEKKKKIKKKKECK